MNRLRRYLPPPLLLLPVILICGKLLFTPVETSVIVAFANPGGPISKNVPERGWPWLYQSAVAGGTYEYNWWILLIDIAVLTATLAFCWLLIMWWWRRSGYRFRFSLRACLLFITIPAVVLGWWMSHVRSWRDEQRYISVCANPISFPGEYLGFEGLKRFFSIENLEVFDRATSLWIQSYSEPLTEEAAAKALAAIPHAPYLKSIECREAVVSTASDGAVQFSPLLSRSRVPDPSVLNHIESFDFSSDYSDLGTLYDYANDESLQILGQLHRIKVLNLGNCKVTDAGLSHLKNCRTLETVDLANTKITDAGLRQLPSSRLQKLNLFGCEITDAGIAHLENCRNLESLTLTDTRITPAGLAHLAGLQKLKVLNLAGTAMDDDTIEIILTFRSLEELNLANCRAIKGHHIQRLLEIPSLCEVELPDLPDVPSKTIKSLKETLLERWYKRMGVP